MSASTQNMYTMMGRNDNPLIKEHSMLGNLFRLLRWTAALCLIVLFVDFVFVVFIWDAGTAHLEYLVQSERSSIGLTHTKAGLIIDSVVSTGHDWVFIKTGLNDWISHTRSGLLSAVIDWSWTFIETATLGLQLFLTRLAVLIVSLPPFAIIGVTAVFDGLYGWLMRRTHGSRESGFIYHRAKRAFPVFVFLLWLTYLVPPVVMDPRIVIPPFVVMFGVALRLRVMYFKKYI